MDNLEQLSKHIKLTDETYKEIELTKVQDENDFSEDNSNSDLDEQAILDAIEKDEESKGNEFDEEDLVKLINMFGNHFKKNQELREIHKKNPEKFMDSEVDLDQDIRKFSVLGVYPQYLKTFYESNALPSLIQLIAHDNIDISTDVISLLSDLVDIEINEQLYDIIIEFYYKLVEKNKLFYCYKRFNENNRDDFNTIHKSLQIIENMLEIIPKFSEEIVNRTPILQWLSKRINNEASIDDDNQLYACEILAILLQTNTENQFTFGNIGGLEDILTIISKYRKSDPETEEQKELIENLYDILCFCLQVKENCDHFRQIQGIELMVRILRANNYSSLLTIKVLNYAFKKNPANCKQFIQGLGLKFLFPFFLKKGIKEKTKEEVLKNDDHILSCVQSLLSQAESVDLERVLNKFRENENEKIERLFEIQKQYATMTMQAQLEFEKKIEIQNEFEETQNSKEELYYHKLFNGLTVLQTNSYIILFLINLNYPDIKLKIKQLQKLHSIPLKHFQQILKNQLKYLKPDDPEVQNIKKVLEESKNKPIIKGSDYPLIQEEKIETYNEFEAN